MSRKHFLLPLIIAILTNSAVHAQSTSQQDLSFGGIPLGIALKDFQKQPALGSGSGGVRAICTGDEAAGQTPAPLGELPMSQELLDAGIVACGYFQTGLIKGTYKSWSPAFPGIGSYTTVFLFTSKDMGANLYSIIIRLNSDHHDRIIQVLSKRHGQPEAMHSTVQNEPGNKFEKIINVWSVGKNEISTTRIFDQSPFLYLRYAIREVDAEIRTRVNSRQNSVRGERL